MSFRLNVTKKRRTTDIHKISVVRLIIYSYSECLFLNSQAYFTSSKSASWMLSSAFAPLSAPG